MAGEATADRPNVLLITVDQWPGPLLGAAGHPVIQTPTLDALAAMYAGAALWVIGYDTIYALQDREDDALVGIKSSALRLGGKVKPGVGAFYAAAVALLRASSTSSGLWVVPSSIFATRSSVGRTMGR